jgi:diguanylate cyclase (GGDEF)-like protein
VEELRRWWREPPAGATRDATTAITGLLYLCVAFMYAAAFVCFDGLSEPLALQVAWVAAPLAIGATMLRLGRRVPAVFEHVSPLIGIVGALTFVVLADRGAMSTPLVMPVLTVLIDSPFKFSLREVLRNTVVALVATATVLAMLGVPCGDIFFIVLASLPVVAVTLWVAHWGDAAEKDVLTGLTNRRGFERRFEAAAADPGSDPLTVALLDLDRFKLVNDLLGHDAGDQLLVACAEAWTPLMPAGTILARRGGDEFAVMIPRLDEPAVDDLLSRVRSACPDGVTLSVGVAVLAPGEATVDLLRRADRALYDAKWTGRDRCVRSSRAGHDAGTAPQAPDPVTGLHFYDPSQHRAPDATAALVIEADRYHATAHVVGTAAGNQILTESADRLLRASAGMWAEVRRLRPSGFLILLNNHSPAEVRALTERLIVPSIHSVASQHGSLTAGVAVGPLAEGGVPALVRAARTAADVARREQPGWFVFFEPWMATEEKERAAVGSALRSAIEHRDIDLVYQPQLRLQDRTLVGVEVLARWYDPVHGMVPPALFVRLADELGLTRPLDILVFEKACAQLRAWDEAGVPVPRISLNISPRTIAAGQVHQGVGRMLAENRLRADRMRIEITETDLLHGPNGATLLQQVRDLGVRVSLDDFGTGYSSFARLARLPIDELKIDRSFLIDIQESGAGTSVLNAMIQLGHALRLDVVVEGVESEEQDVLVRQLGADIGQGYHYGRPMPAEAFESWLTEQRLPSPRRRI